jgi:spore coat protein CotH
MSKRLSLILVGGALVLSACSLPATSVSSASSSLSSKESNSASNSATSLSSSSSLSEDVALPDSPEFTAFWDHKSAVKISLSFSNASLYALSHFGAIDNQKWGDLYFPCQLTISFGGKDYVYDEAGARMKGNTSRREIVDQAGKISQSCHFKVSFKATFDDALYDLDDFKAFKHDWSADPDGLKARKKRNFLGMEKIDLKYLPRNNGKTISQEIYCYDSFRSAGILAPHAQWGSVTLKSEAMSQDFAYEIIEDIDKVFLKRHFSKAEAQGDLYKCVWGTDSSGNWKGADLSRDGAVEKNDSNGALTSGARLAKGRIGVEDNYAGYHPNYQLKTNDDGEASDFSKMSNYINTLWNLRYRKSLQNALESLLDVPEFLKFEALSYLFGNFDDQRNNANNYYLYFRPSDARAIYIPYDWDWGLGANDDSASFVMAKATPLQTTGLAGNITNNVYWLTYFASSGLSYDQKDYIATYLQEVKNGVNAGYLDFANYQKLVAQVPSSFGSSDTSSVSAYMDAKKKTIASSLN